MTDSIVGTDVDSDPLFDPLRRKLTRELLAYAVGRQMFDRFTGEVLDVRRAVAIDGTDAQPSLGYTVLAAHVFDSVKDTPKLAAILATPGVVVVDGRTL